MSKQTKRIVFILAGLAAMLAAVAVTAHFIPHTDENGWVHNDAAGRTEEDENQNREYALVHTNKSDWENMDAHTYINRITSALLAYRGKTHTTFVFEDGTGIMYPGSSMEETAFYGQVNDSGTMETIYGYITINGTAVEYTESASVFSDEVRTVSASIDERFKNDSFYVNIKDDTVYVVISTTENEADVAGEIYGDIEASGISFSDAHIMVNNLAFTVENGAVVPAQYSVTFIE